MKMELENGWLETILRRNAKDKAICRVLSVECNPAVGQGDNYASEMLRVKMKVVLGSGQITTRSVIVKKLPKLQSQLDFLFEYHVFSTEIQVYTEIIPHLEELMLEHGDTSDKLWCDLLACKKYEQLVMQDLKAVGFRNADRRKLLDLDHILLTVRSLARLHAMSAVLIHKGQLDPSKLLPYSLSREKEMMTQFMQTGLNTLADVIRTKWDKKWLEVADKIENFCKVAPQEMADLWRQKNTELVVLNHGDCWINNIMYKYDLGSSTPSAIRLVDFQEAHYNTYAWDLTYLFHTSVSPTMRDESCDRILDEYRKVLLATFQFYDYVPENTPTLDGIKAEMIRLLPYGLMVSGCILPVLMASKEDTMDIEKLLDTESEESYRCRMKMFSSEKFTQYIKKHIELGLSNGKL